MEAPDRKSVKVYAVIESTVTGSPDDIDAYLRKQKFRGNATINYSQGGVTNVVIKEIIPLSMKQIDLICNGNN